MIKLLKILTEDENPGYLKKIISNRFPELKIEISEAMDVLEAAQNIPKGPGWYIWYAKKNTTGLKKHARELSDTFNFGDDPHIDGRGLELYIGLASNFKSRFMSSYSGYFTTTVYASSKKLDNPESYGSDKLQTLIPYFATYDRGYLNFNGDDFYSWLSEKGKLPEYDFETTDLSAKMIINDLNEFFISINKFDNRKEIGKLVSQKIKEWYIDNIKVRFISISPDQWKFFPTGGSNLRVVEGFLIKQLVNMGFRDDNQEMRLTFNKGVVDAGDGDLTLAY